MNLQTTILERLDSKDLVELQNQLPTLGAEKELAARLKRGDAETLIALKGMKPSEFLLKAVREYPMPWRIGVIYNPSNGVIRSIQAGLGNAATKRYQTLNTRYMFTKLESERTGLVLSELNNFYTGAGRLMIDNPKILPILLESPEVKITVGEAINRERTYETPLSRGDNYKYIPIKICSQKGCETIANSARAILETVVEVESSPEVTVYRSFL